jgi:hypothetical protein
MARQLVGAELRLPEFGDRGPPAGHVQIGQVPHRAHRDPAWRLSAR